LEVVSKAGVLGKDEALVLGSTWWGEGGIFPNINNIFISDLVFVIFTEIGGEGRVGRGG
jgi:hypothetical protein